MIVRPAATPTTTTTTPVEDARARIDEAINAVLSSRAPDASRRASLQELGEDAWQGVKDLGVQLGLDRVFLERVEGAYHSGVTTDQRGFDGDITTLGRASFGKFHPVDLKLDTGRGVVDKIRAVTGLPALYRGPFEELERGYLVFAPFSIVEEGQEEGAGGQEPLTGIQTAIAEWGLAGPPEGQEDPNKPHGDKLTVSFRKLRLEPGPGVAQDPARLARWLALLLPHNPTMDPNTGVAEVHLPANGPVGFLRMVLMDPQVEVYVGNMGSHMILKRWTPPEGTRGAELVKRLADRQAMRTNNVAAQQQQA